MKYLAIWLIEFYRAHLSRLKPPTCRFRPTCSEYSLQAFRKYGFLKGMYLAVRRVARCNPFTPGGYDPLP